MHAPVLLSLTDDGCISFSCTFIQILSVSQKLFRLRVFLSRFAYALILDSGFPWKRLLHVLQCAQAKRFVKANTCYEDSYYSHEYLLARNISEKREKNSSPLWFLCTRLHKSSDFHLCSFLSTVCVWFITSYVASF